MQEIFRRVAFGEEFPSTRCLGVSRNLISISQGKSQKHSHSCSNGPDPDAGSSSRIRPEIKTSHVRTYRHGAASSYQRHDPGELLLRRWRREEKCFDRVIVRDTVLGIRLAKVGLRRQRHIDTLMHVPCSYSTNQKRSLYRRSSLYSEAVNTSVGRRHQR
jgi:hypothetical protein